MALPPGHYEFNYNVTLGVWVLRSGAWQKITQVTTNVFAYPGNGGSKTFNWDWSGSLQLGTGIQAFGVTVESFDGTSATVDDLVSVAWTAQPSSGSTASALPNGLKTTVTVRPK